MRIGLKERGLKQNLVSMIDGLVRNALRRFYAEGLKKV
jgi:hypothetical protein